MPVVYLIGIGLKYNLRNSPYEIFTMSLKILKILLIYYIPIAHTLYRTDMDCYLYRQVNLYMVLYVHISLTCSHFVKLTKNCIFSNDKINNNKRPNNMIVIIIILITMMMI